MEEEPNPNSSFCKTPNEAWKVLEFYSGIGGMRYSLTRSCANAVVVEAFDINDTANDVYEHNFGHRPYQGNIQSLDAADLDGYGAHAWLLSPPCQPYTRQGLQKHSGDARAFSFLNILELIPRIKKPPVALFVENVVGFETSDTRAKMVEVLAKAGFVTQEFILSPLQFGVPYSRPRYFCLAKRKPSAFQNKLLIDKLSRSPSSLFHSNDETLLDEYDQSLEISGKIIPSCEPIGNFLEFRNLGGQGDTDISFLETTCDSTDSSGTSETQGEGHDVSCLSHYFVPLSLIERWGSAMDVVYPDSKRCCCFTKSYYRYVKGTGSVLATVQPEKKGKATPLEEQRPRFFTPREVANLHSFPKEFQFPEHISLRQRYALLGNSLSTAVVAPLLQYLFTDPS